MNIADARSDLVATLADTGYPVYAYDTTKINRPLILIDEAQPFLAYSDVLSASQFDINFTVWLFMPLGDLEKTTKQMDTMLQTSVLNLGEWTLTDLESHIRTVLVENGPVYLASKLSVTNQISLTVPQVNAGDSQDI